MRRWVVWLLLLALCLPSGTWAKSLQYVTPGTVVTFGDSGQTPVGSTLVVWTLTALGSGAGQISDRYDKGAGAQPADWYWRCRFALNGTNIAGATIELYASTSDGTNPDGQVGTTNGSLASDKRRNLKLLGLIVVDQTTTNTIMTASGRAYLPERYFSLGVWNATTLPFQTSTTAMRCTMTPTPIEMQ